MIIGPPAEGTSDQHTLHSTHGVRRSASLHPPLEVLWGVAVVPQPVEIDKPTVF